MTLIACGQADILGDTCIECEGPLARDLPAGYPAQIGRVCSEDCATDQTARIARQNRQTHLNQRDLLCDCPDICAPAGRPTPAERQEYVDYQASQR